MIWLVQRAGFEPANQYGLGPHPSAFDQAGQPLRSIPPTEHLYFNTAKWYEQVMERTLSSRSNLHRLQKSD